MPQVSTKPRLLFFVPLNAPLIARLKPNLEKHYAVDTVSAVEDGIAHMSQHEYACVLVKMSDGIEGEELLTAVRAQQWGGKTQISV